MKAFDSYKTYLALKRHFETESYDYFKYGGKVSASAESFERRKDVKQFLRISRHHDPFNLMVGNFILSSNSVIPYSINEELYVSYMAIKANVAYNFKKDIQKFRPNLVENLVIDETLSVPYIMDLYLQGKISFSTIAVFEGIFSCKTRWEKKDEFILFENASKKISKSWQFLDIPLDKYKEAVKTVFNV